jgi:hypothetical protein
MQLHRNRKNAWIITHDELNEINLSHPCQQEERATINIQRYGNIRISKNGRDEFCQWNSSTLKLLSGKGAIISRWKIGSTWRQNGEHRKYGILNIILRGGIYHTKILESSSAPLIGCRDYKRTRHKCITCRFQRALCKHLNTFRPLS